MRDELNSVKPLGTACLLLVAGCASLACYVVTLAGVTIAGRSSALPARVSRNASTA